jgi:transposase
MGAEPHMPPAKRLGQPRETELRNVLDAICCQWRMLPKEFPPFTRVPGYFFYDWHWRKIAINFHLLLQARETAGRDASPSAGVEFRNNAPGLEPTWSTGTPVVSCLGESLDGRAQCLSPHGSLGDYSSYSSFL